KRYGYSRSSKSYSKDLSFPTNDSTIAVLRINDFRKGKTKELHKEIFSDIKNHHVDNLILDIRNNGGGYIKDAHYLYSYLVEDSKPFLGKKIVANKTSFGKSLYNLFPIPTYPLLWLGSGYTFFSTSKMDNEEYELKMPFSFVKIDENLVYKGNLYVLINGGSYSASSLIASNLQIKNRAYFVGEETGGDFNGTVAGLMPKFKMPHTKLHFSVGTVYLSPIEMREEKGRG
ncbi:MAG: S41 family peptidase, partial [Algoriella sp.]